MLITSIIYYLIYIIIHKNIKVIYGELQVIPRRYTCCTRIKDIVYCYGGYQNGTAPADEHISLDLSSLNQPFASFNELKLEWQPLPNTITYPSHSTKKIGTDTRISIPHPNENSYLLYGTDEESTFIIKYDINQHQWFHVTSVPIPSPVGIYEFGGMVGLKENSSIWLLGTNQKNDESYNATIDVFNYNKLIWAPRLKYNYPLRTKNTATLASNGIIYIIGGSLFKPCSKEYEKYYNNFTKMILFDTKSYIWSNLTATLKPKHFIPSNREYHTTNEIVDKNLFIIYGGMNLENPVTVNDPYYIYDYKNNILETVKPTLGFETYKIFIHCATIYQNKYLVLLFGNTDKNYPAKEIIKILNITNPFSPKWIRNNTLYHPTSLPSTSLSIFMTTSSIPTSSSLTHFDNHIEIPNNELNQTLKIVIITSSIIGVLIIILSILFILKNKREKRKARFIIEQGHCFEMLDYEPLKEGEYQYYNDQQENNDRMNKPFDKSPQDNFIEYGKLYDQQPNDHFCKPNKNQA